MNRLNMPTSCPACGHALDVLRLGCAACGTAIEGRFALGRLARLSRAQLDFVEVFLECRGKIKDVEQRLGVSYPTVVARLDEVVVAMGATDGDASPKAEAAPRAATPAAPRAKVAEVLEALERGEITASDAAARLRGQRIGGV